MNNQLKLKFYYNHILGTVYAEGDSPFHQEITQKVVDKFIQPLDLPKNSKILDVGCGPGYFLDYMQQLGYTDCLGITLSPDDVNLCRSKNRRVEQRDMNFLTETDESVDLIFSRHSLEHSPFPYITLLEYNRVLKPNGVLYIEVPQPDCELQHEDNRNHFSILGKSMWMSLLSRTGYEVELTTFEFPLFFPDERGTKQEKYFIFLARRRRPVDIK